MARAPELDDLIKSFSSPALGLVKTGPQGIGLHPALFDALMDEPRLVLQARRKGVRVACPRVEDNPVSRRLLDRIAEDEDATEQAHGLLSGEVDRQSSLGESVVLRSLSLVHLLPHVPALPLASVAALHEPTNIRRRQAVAHWLAAAAKSGALPVNARLVHRRDYADFQGRPASRSPFLPAWLGAPAAAGHAG